MKKCTTVAHRTFWQGRNTDGYWQECAHFERTMGLYMLLCTVWRSKHY